MGVRAKGVGMGCPIFFSVGCKWGGIACPIFFRVRCVVFFSSLQGWEGAKEMFAIFFFFQNGNGGVCSLFLRWR